VGAKEFFDKGAEILAVKIVIKLTALALYLPAIQSTRL
jgi:hypothetical protein